MDNEWQMNAMNESRYFQTLFRDSLSANLSKSSSNIRVFWVKAAGVEQSFL